MADAFRNDQDRAAFQKALDSIGDLEKEESVKAKILSRGALSRSLDQIGKPIPATSVPTGTSELTFKQRKALRSRTRQVRQVEREATSLDIDTDTTPKHKGFWWLLDMLDRPRNAAHNVVHGAFARDEIGYFTDLGTQTKRIKNGWGDFNSGWLGQERSNFEDILEDMGADAHIAKALAITKLDDNISLPMAMKIAGFAGDVTLDPINVVPGAVGKQIFKIGGGGLKAFGRATKLDDLVGGLFQRSTGIPQLDGLIDKTIDLGHANARDLLNRGSTIFQKMKSLRKKHKGLISELAEETNFAQVKQFALQVRAGKITPENVDGVLSNFENFRNPDAVREFIGITDPKILEQVDVGVDTLRKFGEETQMLEAISGKATKTLGAQLEAKVAAADRVVSASVKGITGRAIAVSKKKSADTAREVAGNRGALGRIIGKEKMRSLDRAVRKTGEAAESAALGGDGVTGATTRQFLKKVFEEYDPNLIAAMKETPTGATGFSAYYDDFLNEVISNVGNDKKLFEAVQRHDELVGELAKMPNYVKHLMDNNALDQVVKKKGLARAVFRTKVRSPKTSSDMVRSFVNNNGRPLSIEEVEKIIASGEAIGPLRSVGPIRKLTPLDRLLKREGKLAKFLNTDERAIIETRALETAKSTAMAEFFLGKVGKEGRVITKGVKQIFGLDADQFSKLRPEQQAKWQLLDTFENGTKLVEELPGLKGTYLPLDQIDEILTAGNRFVDPDAAGKLLRYYDSMQNWWISYTLPLYVGFHSRNMIGNFMNMIDAGFMSHPTDIVDSMKATALQMRIMRDNVEGSRSLKFFVKKLGTQIDGTEMSNLMLKRGIVDSGFFGGQVGEAVGNMTDSIWRNPWSYHPLSRNSIAVRGGKAVGTFLENQARATTFINKLRKGSTVDEAAAVTKKFHGDYRREIMTPFEQDVAGRFMPFWRWARFNVPLQIEQTLISQGKRQRMLALLKGQELGQDIVAQATGGAPVGFTTNDLPPETPEWIQEAAGVPVRRDPDTGEIEFFLMENWLPAADLDNFLPFSKSGVRETSEFMLGMVSPLIKVPFIEFPLGRSVFLDRELKDQPPAEFGGRMLDPEFINLVRNLRFLSEFDRLDPLSSFHKVRKQTPMNVRLLRAVGIPRFTVNLAREKLRFAKERTDDLRRRIGIIRRVEAVEREQEKNKGR